MLNCIFENEGKLSPTKQNTKFKIKRYMECPDTEETFTVVTLYLIEMGKYC